MRLIFHPDVKLEVEASYIWYEKKARGLGDDFLNELEVSYDAVCELPETWPKFQKGFRRFLLSRFPFSVIYRTNKDTVYVIAVMNNNRKPGYWTDRI